MNYSDDFKKSIENPEAFWGEKAEDLFWFQKPEQVLSQDKEGFYRWFKGGVLNTSYLALDYHIEIDHGDNIAMIFDSPVTGTKQKFTYLELRDKVAAFSGALQELGVRKGDRVVIYMPMIPEAVISMLGCARIGAVHSVVFGGFAPNELAIRIDDAKPKIIVTASNGIEFTRVISYKPLIDSAIEQAKHKPEHCIVLQRPQVTADLIPGRDLDYSELVTKARPGAYIPVEATDPLYILYTSGTTGKPKGIVRDNGGHAVALKASMKQIYGIERGDVFWAASDVGWVVGHSYIVYAPLLAGATTILFEGKPVRTPHAGVFWRILSEYKVKTFFTAPTAFRAIKKEDPFGNMCKNYDLSKLKYLFLAGERLDPPTYHWLKELLPDKPIVDHWWQTESGWPMVANPIGIEKFDVKPGSATKPVYGYDVQILDDDGKQVKANTEGNIAVKLPLPPGCLPTLWNDKKRFLASYLERFPGYYHTGDGGYIDEDGFVFIMGRTDDVINVAGHRLSTGAMEEHIASHPAVAECAVVGINDELRGQAPAGFVVIKDRYKVDEHSLSGELITMIREEIGSFANFRQTAVVKRLPKTRSGKILRHLIRKIADGEEYSIPSTIDDVGILDEIKEVLYQKQIGNAFQTDGI
ncbi:MAG: propionyl-CoA synthetase [Calditrichaeota bacterium]|nr:MAG: propionyl-CoA synthetase [Calditrichota bacterium]MBL1207727.1 propionyl-CoA synthetase [Calditrichota bacterium]NOG47561.1 propionyl-CoA synthetase [Calditrichota bacterium]